MSYPPPPAPQPPAPQPQAQPQKWRTILTIVAAVTGCLALLIVVVFVATSGNRQQDTGAQQQQTTQPQPQADSTQTEEETEEEKPSRPVDENGFTVYEGMQQVDTEPLTFQYVLETNSITGEQALATFTVDKVWVASRTPTDAAKYLLIDAKVTNGEYDYPSVGLPKLLLRQNGTELEKEENDWADADSTGMAVDHAKLKAGESKMFRIAYRLGHGENGKADVAVTYDFPSVELGFNPADLPADTPDAVWKLP